MEDKWAARRARRTCGRKEILCLVCWGEPNREVELIGQDVGGLIHGGALDCGGMRRRKSNVPVEQNGQMVALGLASGTSGSTWAEGSGEGLGVPGGQEANKAT
jgi:hypothetical protein